MASTPEGEGNLQAPTRHPLDWKSAPMYHQGAR
jgi:hypothetical protein